MPPELWLLFAVLCFLHCLSAAYTLGHIRGYRLCDRYYRGKLAELSPEHAEELELTEED